MLRSLTDRRIRRFSARSRVRLYQLKDGGDRRRSKRQAPRLDLFEMAMLEEGNAGAAQRHKDQQNDEMEARRHPTKMPRHKKKQTPTNPPSNMPGTTAPMTTVEKKNRTAKARPQMPPITAAASV